MADKDLQDQYEDDFDSNDSEYFDEFDDADASVDDGDWDEMDGDVDGEYQQPAPQKKKSSFLTYLIIGIVVLGGGAFAVSQMGGGEDVAGTEVADNEMPVMEAASSEAPADSEQNQVAAVDDASQMPVPAPAENVATVETVPTPSPTEGGFVPLTPDTDMAMPEGQVVTEEVTPPSLPELGGGLMTVPDTPAPEMETSAPAPADMAAEGINDQRSNDFPSVDMIKRTDKQTPEAMTLDQAAEQATKVEDVAPLAVQAELDVPVVAPQMEPTPVVQAADAPVSSSEAAKGDDLMKDEMRKAINQIAELQATVEKQEEQRSDYMS